MKNKLARILDVWLNTKFEGGRHERRVKKIEELIIYSKYLL